MVAECKPSWRKHCCFKTIGAHRTPTPCEGGDSTEVLEAKAHASHPYVRQALGQILDYTHSITAPVTTIAALFPSRPSNDDIALLNHYGVDCIYRSASGAFPRETANPSRRGIWKTA
jgi:hypothetical protein